MKTGQKRFIMKFRKIFFLAILLTYNQFSFAGIVVGATRLIYNEGDADASVSITNSTAKNIYLIQSWIENENGSKSSSFLVTPPLFRIDPQKENTLRVIDTSDNLPKDKESLFWLNIKQIPAVDTENSGNSLQLVVKSRMKLIVRPKGLSQNAAEAYRLLTFSKENNTLHIQNPTPYYVSLYKLKINGTEKNGVDYIQPKGSYTVKGISSDKHLKIEWQSVTDSGGITPSTSTNL